MNNYILEFEKPIRELENKINELQELAAGGKLGVVSEINRLRKRAEKLRKETFLHLTRWQHVQLARHPLRPYALDYIERITEKFVELHGDRNFRDDPAIISGIAYWDGRRAVIIGQQKGRGTRQNLKRNFGMSHPEGYRKALRVMKLAEKFNLPVITLIDTPGAYPGIGAEERGQASAIAENLHEMAQLKVPIIAVVIGEGGSGGALALGVADQVLMLRYAVYSVISPEGCASILYREASQAQLAADAMKITAPDLVEAGLIDGIIEEPVGGAHNDPAAAAEEIKRAVSESIAALSELDPDERIEKRIAKYCSMGQWKEA